MTVKVFLVLINYWRVACHRHFDCRADGTWLFRKRARKTQEETGKITPVWLISIPIIVLSPFVGLLHRGLAAYVFDYPELKGFNFANGMTMVPEMMALLIALVIYSATFIAETVRGGIQAVSHGQTEASSCAGHEPWHGVAPCGHSASHARHHSAAGQPVSEPDKKLVTCHRHRLPRFDVCGGTVNNQSGKAIEVVFILMVVYLSFSLLTAAFMNWFNSRMKLVER